MKRYFLYLQSYTFLWIQNDTILIYNSQSGKSIRISNNSSLNPIVNKLLDIKNMYCIELSYDDVNNKDINYFIQKVDASNSGACFLKKEEQPKPVILLPILNLQRGKDRLTKEPDRFIGENILTYLHEVTIHLGADDFTMIGQPNFSGNKKKLLFAELKQFLNSLKGSNVNKINISGWNYPNYSDLYLLIDELDQMSVVKEFYLPINNFPNALDRLKFLYSEQFRLKIFVSDNFDSKQVDLIFHQLQQTPISFEWEFMISSQNSYHLVSKVIDELSLDNINIKPIFNKKNFRFFEDHIYLTEEDLQIPCLSKREVFAHQALNTNDFGKLTIMPDGKVYANPQYSALGTIKDDVRELLCKEMDEGKSWLRIRDMKPCCDCVYQWLCPSPSNYELAIGKPNLCHVKP